MAVVALNSARDKAKAVRLINDFKLIEKALYLIADDENWSNWPLTGASQAAPWGPSGQMSLVNIPNFEKYLDEDIEPVWGDVSLKYSMPAGAMSYSYICTNIDNCFIAVWGVGSRDIRVLREANNIVDGSKEVDVGPYLNLAGKFSYSTFPDGSILIIYKLDRYK